MSNIYLPSLEESGMSGMKSILMLSSVHATRVTWFCQGIVADHFLIFTPATRIAIFTGRSTWRSAPPNETFILGTLFLCQLCQYWIQNTPGSAGHLIYSLSR